MSQAPDQSDAVIPPTPAKDAGSNRVVVRTTSWVRDPTLPTPAPEGTRCASCGYDLSNATSVTCPECGKQLGGYIPVPRRAPLGGFLVLCTTAYALSTIGFFVFGCAGLVGAINGPSRGIGAVCVVLAAASGLIVRWLVHRPEGYPNTRPPVERALVWIGIGFPAALIICMVAALAYVVAAMLLRTFTQIELPLEARMLGLIAVSAAVVWTLVGMLRALKR